jgi:hypothetical protein
VAHIWILEGVYCTVRRTSYQILRVYYTYYWQQLLNKNDTNLSQTRANTGREPALTNHPPHCWEPNPWIRPHKTLRNRNSLHFSIQTFQSGSPSPIHEPTILVVPCMRPSATRDPATLVSLSVPVSLRSSTAETLRRTSVCYACRGLWDQLDPPSLARISPAKMM